MKQRYIVRLHKLVREKMDLLAGKDGIYTATFVASVIEEMCNDLDIKSHIVHPNSIVYFEANRTSRSGSRENREKQISIFLSDKAYNKVGELTEHLRLTENKHYNISFTIRDLIFHWLDKQ